MFAMWSKKAAAVASISERNRCRADRFWCPLQRVCWWSGLKCLSREHSCWPQICCRGETVSAFLTELAKKTPTIALGEVCQKRYVKIHHCVALAWARRTQMSETGHDRALVCIRAAGYLTVLPLRVSVGDLVPLFHPFMMFAAWMALW